MDGPTKVLTIGIGALTAVAAYLGWQNSSETPEIIDSDVHDYDSKVKQRNKTKVAGAFSNTIESDEEKQDEVDEKSKAEDVEEAEEAKSEEAKAEEAKAEEAEEAEEAKAEEAKAEAEEVQEVRAEVKTEIKHHMDKLPQESPWGTFWRSEYDEIANEKSSN